MSRARVILVNADRVLFKSQPIDIANLPEVDREQVAALNRLSNAGLRIVVTSRLLNEAEQNVSIGDLATQLRDLLEGSNLLFDRIYAEFGIPPYDLFVDTAQAKEIVDDLIEKWGLTLSTPAESRFGDQDGAGGTEETGGASVGDGSSDADAD